MSRKHCRYSVIKCNSTVTHLSSESFHFTLQLDNFIHALIPLMRWNNTVVLLLQSVQIGFSSGSFLFNEMQTLDSKLLGSMQFVALPSQNRQSAVEFIDKFFARIGLLLVMTRAIHRMISFTEVFNNVHVFVCRYPYTCVLIRVYRGTFGGRSEVGGVFPRLFRWHFVNDYDS